MAKRNDQEFMIEERFRSLHRFRLFVPVVFWIASVVILHNLTFTTTTTTTASFPLLYQTSSTIFIILRSLRQVTTARHDTFYKSSIHYLITATTTVGSFSIVPICTAFSITPHRFHRTQRPSDLVRCSNMADASDIRDSSSDGGNGTTGCATDHVVAPTTSSSTEDAAIMIQPLYITIGPPCSGKTTWIRTQNSNKNRTNRPAILDICIDDQPGVYYPVATEYILPQPLHDGQDETNPMSRPRQEFLSNIIYGRTVKDRINDISELYAVLLRLSNQTTKDDFQNSIFLLAPTVVEVVEDIICEFESKQQPIVLPSTIDLFIIDAIFRRPPPMTSPTSTTTTDDGCVTKDVAPPRSALERTEQWLYDTPGDTPIAYGNTNTRPTDYVKALQMAMKLNRPVHFVVYCDQDIEYFDREIIDLTGENGLKGLIRRNLYRFLQTGRYVPEQVISDMRDRTHDMIRNVGIAMQHSVAAANTLESNPQPRMNKKLEFHQQLARIAGFEMNHERIITATIRDQRSAPHVVRNVNPRNERTLHPKKHDRPVTTTPQVRSRPWDRPVSAVRGYKGQLDHFHRKQQDDPPNDSDPKERK